MRRDAVLTYRWHHSAIHLSARVGNPLGGASSANRMRNEDFDTASRHRRRACLAAPWFGGAGRRQVSRLERDYRRRDFEITGLRRLESGEARTNLRKQNRVNWWMIVGALLDDGKCRRASRCDEKGQIRGYLE
jgi:hypothetical protein